MHAWSQQLQAAEIYARRGGDDRAWMKNSWVQIGPLYPWVCKGFFACWERQVGKAIVDLRGQPHNPYGDGTMVKSLLHCLSHSYVWIMASRAQRLWPSASKCSFTKKKKYMCIIETVCLWKVSQTINKKLHKKHMEWRVWLLNCFSHSKHNYIIALSIFYW